MTSLRHQAIALALLPLVLIASFLGGYQLGEYMTEERIKVGPYEARGIRVQLEIYRNGELVYVDYDDPATRNLTALLAMLIAGDVIGNEVKNNRNYSYAPVTTDNYYIYIVKSTWYLGYVFISYDSTISYSYSMNTLPANIETGTISAGGVTYDDNTKSIILSATINVQNGGTVYAVGLYTNLKANVISSTGTTALDVIKDVLLFWDDLGVNAFTVNPGDVVTVVYKITVP